MTIKKLRKLFADTQPNPEKKGKVFRLKFIKRDGSVRNMKARLGMQRNLTYTGQNYNPSEYDIQTVWSVGDQGYRNVRLDSIIEFNGEKI